jgi:hypothetical protein
MKAWCRRRRQLHVILDCAVNRYFNVLSVIEDTWPVGYAGSLSWWRVGVMVICDVLEENAVSTRSRDDRECHYLARRGAKVGHVNEDAG